MTRLQIVADENIPALETLFSDLGNIIKLPGRQMTAEDLAGADVLLVRSVTKVNAQLLAKSRVKFVGTCTIGTDHLDKHYFEREKIPWSAAPGCNAGGVVQYVLAAMATYSPDWATKTVGIVGCGNVGGRLYRTLKALGVTVNVYDPHKLPKNIPELTTLETVLRSDIICLHTPLIKNGQHPTEKLIHALNLPLLKKNALLISAGRGEVIDNIALFDYLKLNPALNVVLDVWQGEPNILEPLMGFIRCGTPHIAGYSFEGKLNGSLMIYEAFAKYLGVSPVAIANKLAVVRQSVLGEQSPLVAATINEAVLATYDIQMDHRLIASAIERGEPMSTAFDQLRKNYWQRRELSHYFSDSNSCIVGDFLKLVNAIKK